MRTLAQWHSELNRIDETKLDRNFVESEEFVAILLDVLVMNSKTHQSEKTGLFAQLGLFRSLLSIECLTQVVR